MMGMHLKELKVRNFGPYHGPQSLAFGSNRSITIVHGENMRGKTSLLNSVRWALYGRALDRLALPMPIRDLINWDAAEAKDWTMSVQITFQVDGHAYEVARQVQPKGTIANPITDGDFDERLYVSRDGSFLPQDEGQRELNRLLPEQISRFFLFDGELLSEYEVLLSDTDKQAQAIKDSIEHILGVPVVTHTLADLRHNLKEAARRQQQAARQDQAATAYAAEAARLSTEIEMLETDLRDLNGQRESLAARLRDLDDSLRATQGIEGEVERLKQIQDQIARLKSEESDLLARKRDLLADAWSDLIAPKVQERIVALEAEQAKHVQSLWRMGDLKARIDDLSAAIDSGVCPICTQQVPKALIEGTRKRAGDAQVALQELQIDHQRFGEVSDALRRLRRISRSGVTRAIEETEERISRVRINLSDLDLQQEEINARLKLHDVTTVSRNRRDHSDVTKELGVLEKAIREKELSIREKQAEADRVRTKIRQVGGPRVHRANREVQIYEEAIAVFQKILDRLRDEMRKNVEGDASEIFRQLTTDKSYRGLRINNYYYLTILDKDGNEVTVRSAGADQVVALALIGALNKNAVRRGPVIMDTPFGRLDPTHRENILRFLPSMADQVTLLVHSGELNRHTDLPNIQDKVEREYEIQYETSRRSRIARVRS